MTQDSPTSHPQPRRTIGVARDRVEITRLAPPPALPAPTATHEAAYLTAAREAATRGHLAAALPPGLARALARAATDDPGRTTNRIGSGLLTSSTDEADIAVLRTTLSPLTVLPGDQPRGGSAGGRAAQVHEPGEGQDPTASPLGLRVLAFDDLDHLRTWCADTLRRSLPRALHRGRHHEIAATGVRRPVATSMVLLQFADSGSSQWVPMLSDGMSRHSVCLAGLLGLLDDPDAGDNMAEQLIPAVRLSPDSPSHTLTRRMRRNHQRTTDDYLRHVRDDGPDETAIRARQFLTLPTDLHLLATNPATGQPHPMEPVMEAVVSDQHTGVDGWAPEDDKRHTALRALKRLRREDKISQELLDLFTGRVPVPTGPPTAPIRLGCPPTSASADAQPSADEVTRDRWLLQRAVTTMTTLLGPAHYPQFKAALRAVSGRQRLTGAQVVEYVAPLVCEPWGALRPMARAWSYGGPVLASLHDTSLEPAHPADYLTLVDAALGARTDAAQEARLELAIAGGTALIADGVLTTAIVGGSGSSPTPLAYRGSISSVVDALTSTREGLTLLAVAANNFRPTRNARASSSPTIDLTQPDKVARDGVGVAVRVTETMLANYAALANQTPASAGPATTTLEPTPLENLQARARQLPADTRSTLRSIELTRALYDETGGPSGLSEHDLDTVHDSLSRALKLVGRLA